MLAFIVVISGLVACGDDTARDYGTVRGFITEVTGSSLTEFETLALEDDNGTTWLFESNGKSFPGIHSISS